MSVSFWISLSPQRWKLYIPGSGTTSNGRVGRDYPLIEPSGVDLLKSSGPFTLYIVKMSVRHSILSQWIDGLTLTLTLLSDLHTSTSFPVPKPLIDRRDSVTVTWKERKLRVLCMDPVSFFLSRGKRFTLTIFVLHDCPLWRGERIRIQNIIHKV